MSFQSLQFLAFLAVTAVCCLLTGRICPSVGKFVLVTACLVFYLSGTSNPLLGFAVLLAGMAVTLAAARIMTTRGQKKAAFAAAVVWHVAVLLVFKYTGFFTGGAMAIDWAPIGLSYFTFQQIWFLKEVFTGQFVPEWKGIAGLRDFFVYTFFFPTIVSGPILRPGAFLPQLTGEKLFRPDWQDAAAGLFCICTGIVKKALLADSLGILVNNVWDYQDSISAVTAWLAILGYTLQLYFDFSGYCDIAAGAARLLGIRLPINFDSPYRSLSVTEFWKRWHITLTTFLRECVYIPLGGSRKGALRTYVNILVVFLVSGFWHGAGWTFIVWGALHGLAQMAERLLGSWTERFPKILRWGVTFLFVALAWVFFRAPDIAGATELLREAFSCDFALPDAWIVEGLFSEEVEALRLLFPEVKPYLTYVLMAPLYTVGMLMVLWPRSASREMEDTVPGFLRTVLLVVMTAWAILSFTGVETFIYSGF